MDEIFKNVEAEKRERIINSALEEFSKNGFEKASTNEIVKNANISKGSLFHYFGNKQQLFDKLIEFVVELINDSISNTINWEESDFFLRVKEVVLIKASMTNRYPYIYDFFTVIFEGKSIKEMKTIAGKQTGELSQKIYTHNIDFSLFKDGIDLTITMNIIQWTFEKFSEEAWEKSKNQGVTLDMKGISEESDAYINALRKAFYKKQVM